MRAQRSLNLVLLLAVVAAVGLVVVGLTAELRSTQRRLQSVMAQTLAQVLEREVQVGRVRGGPPGPFIVEDLAVARKGGFGRGVEYGARRLSIEYSLLAVVRGELSAPAAVKRITIEGGYGVIDESADAETLKKLFKAKPFKRIPPEKKFQPLIVVKDTVLDLRVSAGKKQVSVRLADVSARAKFNPVGPIQIALTARSGDGAFRSLAVRAQSLAEERYFTAQGRIEGVAGERLGEMFLTGPDVRLNSGTVSSDFELWVGPQSGEVVGPITYRLADGEKLPEAKRVFGFRAEAEISGAQVEVRKLGPPVKIASAWVEAGPEGARVEGLEGAWLGAELSGGGFFGFNSKQAEVSFTARGVDLKEIKGRLPEAVTKGWPLLPEGRADVTVTAAGPTAHLNAQVAVQLPPGQLVRTTLAGGIDLSGVTLQAEVLDVAQPVVEAEVAAERVTPRPQAVAQLGKDLGAEVEVKALQGLQASVRWAGEQALVMAEVGELAGSYEGVALTARGGRFRLAGKELRAEGLHVETLGGSVEGEATVRLAVQGRPGAEVYFDAQARDLDLSRLPRSLTKSLSASPAGELSGEYSGVWRDGAAEVVGRADLRGAKVQSYGVDALTGLVVAGVGPEGHWGVELPVARLTAPGVEAGVVGRVSQSEGMDLQLELTEVDLGKMKLPGNGVGKDLTGGRAYGAVHVTGTWERPTISGDLGIFGLDYGRVGGATVVASFTVSPKSLQPKDLLPPQAGWVSGYGSYAGALAEIGARFSPPGPEDPAPKVDADLAVVQLRLATLRELAPKWVPEGADLNGLAEFTAKVSGDTISPVGEGELRLSQVQYKSYYVDSVLAPWHGEMSPEDEEYVTVTGGRMLAQGAAITFDGHLRDVFDAWKFEVNARATNVDLEKVVVLQQLGLPLAGMANIPTAKMVVTADGVRGEGRLLADRVALDGQALTGLDTHFVATPGTLRLDRTSFGAAGGTVRAAATYVLSSKELTGELELEKLRLPELLRLTAPMAATMAPKDKAAEVREDWMRWSVAADGELSGKASWKGPARKPVGTAQMQVANGLYLGRPLPEIKVSTNFDMGTGVFDNIAGELQMGEALALVEGTARLDGDLRMTADASNVDLAAWRDWFPPSLALGGLASVTVVAEGSTKSPRIRASVDVVSASVRGVSFDLVQVPVVTIAEGGIELEHIIAKRGEREATGTGHLPFSWHPVGLREDQPIAFAAKLENADLGLVPTIAEEVRKAANPEAVEPSSWVHTVATGTVNANLKVGGTLRAPAVEGFLQLDQGAFRKPNWRTPFTDLSARMTVRSVGGVNRVEIEEMTGRWDQTQFRMAGNMDVNSFRWADVGRNRYDVTLQAAAPEQLVITGLPIRGLRGRMSLRTGEDHQQKVVLNELMGQFGEGLIQGSGDVVVTRFNRSEWASNQFNLRFIADHAIVSYPNLVAGELNGQATVRNPEPGAAAQVSGFFNLRRAKFGLPQVAAQQGKPYTILAARPIRDRQGRDLTFGLDLRMGLGPEVRLKTASVSAGIAPTDEAMVIRGTLARPEIHGGLSLDEGAKVTGANLTLSSGTLTYQTVLSDAMPHDASPNPRQLVSLTGGYAIDAEQTVGVVNVEGRELGPVHVLLRITGDLAHPGPPVVYATSEPPLTTEQIFLVVGLSPYTGSGTTDVNQLLSQGVADLLASGVQAALLAPVQAELRRSLGLDEFSVVVAFDRPLELSLAKRLVKNMLVTYRYRAIGQDEEQWNLGLSYELPNNTRVTFGTDENDNTQFRVSHGWSF